MPRRVLIADDNASVRKVLRNYFASRADLELCGEASNGREAIDLALAHKPDLLILDVVMPELNGIEVSGVLKDELPNARIILFTLFGESVGRNLASAAGVKVVLEKSDGLTTLVCELDRYVRQFNDPPQPSDSPAKKKAANPQHGS